MTSATGMHVTNMVRHPIYVAGRSKKNEQKVEEKIDSNQEQLSEISQSKPFGYGGVFDAVFAPESRQPIESISETDLMLLFDYHKRLAAADTSTAADMRVHFDILCLRDRSDGSYRSGPGQSFFSRAETSMTTAVVSLHR
jgi:hypothetical protein